MHVSEAGGNFQIFLFFLHSRFNNNIVCIWATVSSLKRKIQKKEKKIVTPFEVPDLSV